MVWDVYRLGAENAHTGQLLNAIGLVLAASSCADEAAIVISSNSPGWKYGDVFHGPLTYRFPQDSVEELAGDIDVVEGLFGGGPYDSGTYVTSLMLFRPERFCRRALSFLVRDLRRGGEDPAAVLRGARAALRSDALASASLAPLLAMKDLDTSCDGLVPPLPSDLGGLTAAPCGALKALRAMAVAFESPAPSLMLLSVCVDPSVHGAHVRSMWHALVATQAGLEMPSETTFGRFASDIAAGKLKKDVSYLRTRLIRDVPKNLCRNHSIFRTAILGDMATPDNGDHPSLVVSDSFPLWMLSSGMMSSPVPSASGKALRGLAERLFARAIRKGHGERLAERGRYYVSGFARRTPSIKAKPEKE